MYGIEQFASTESTTDGGLLSVLGIDWMMLSFQIIAFLILVWFLSKFVFPWLLKSVDERQSVIESSVKAANEAEKKASEAEKNIAKLLADSKREATEIVSSAKTEAASLIALAEEKSKKRAEQIAEDSKKQIDKDVLAAKQELHNEMIDLVALAVEKISGKVISSEVDNKIIASFLRDEK